MGYSSPVVQGEGPVPCRVMFIGERPGEQEVMAHPPRPFVGRTGLELNRFLKGAGIRREEVFITNLVRDYRGGEKPSEE